MLDTVFLDPPLAQPLIAGVGVALALIVIGGYALSWRSIGSFRRAALLTMRLAVLAGLLVLLMRPMAFEPREEVREKPVFSIMLDCSKSMCTEDAGEDSRGRFEAAIDALRRQDGDALRRLNANYHLKFYRFAKDLRPVSLEELTALARPDGEATHLAQALLNVVQANQDRKHGGILLISDGRDNEGSTLAGVRGVGRQLRAERIPVWTVPVGAATVVKDVSVVARLSSNFIFVKQPATLQVVVAASGYSNWYARVNLYREDEYVESKEVHLRDGHARLSFPVREEHKGVFQYRVEVEPLAGETDVLNNKRSVMARVVDDRTGVLVLEARPYWDSKFLLRALRADTNVDVTAVFSINPRKVFAIAERLSDEDMTQKDVSRDVKMPTTKDELFKYDCVFLGKDLASALSGDQLKLFRDYLTERGGSLVFFRGKPYEGELPDAADIEPVEWGSESLDSARFELTRQGRATPIFDFGQGKESDVVIRELPEMISLAEVREEKSLAVVLARGKGGEANQELAAIAYHRYGKGKVMSIAATGLWRWAFLPEKLERYDEVYRRFWSQMIRWLVSDSDFLPGQDIAFRTSKYTYAPGETVRMTVHTKHVELARYHPRIELVQPDGKTMMLTPAEQEEHKGTYMTYYKPELEGEYKAILHNDAGEPKRDVARFTVYEDSVEQRYVSVDRELMEQVAGMTGGSMLELEELGELPDMAREFERVTRERVEPIDVWDKLPVFLALVGMLGVEWLTRRKSGLV